MSSNSQTKNTSPREGFSSSLAVIAATLGSAVGLGNIWKFPYVTGQNGGAAFVLIYLFCIALVGLPVMISELIIGRTAKADAVTSFKKLVPGEPWYLVGAFGALSSFIIMAFYTTVAGWVYAYIFKAASGALSSVKADYTTKVFNTFTSQPLPPLFWQLVVLAVVGLIIMAGVTKGIERVTKTMMPLLFLLLLVVDIRSLTLPGASKGLDFLFHPDFTKITAAVILSALGLAFFKLSLGMGTIITYGSYYSDKENLPLTAIKVALADTVVSLMAGVAIFPAVFAFGFKPDAGPSLLFMTIPTVFSSMPLGRLFMVLFFILVAIAATGAMISLLEVPVAYLVETRGWTRRQATLLTIIALALLGSTATFSTSILAGVKIFGKTFFDLFDFSTSNVLMPISSFFTALFIGWRWGFKKVQLYASNQGDLQNEGLLRLYFIITRYIAPVAIFLILLSGLNLIRL